MVREVLSSLDRPVLMGHSFGGRIAVQAGAAYPELVRGIVLTGVPLLRSPVEVGKPALRYRMARFLHRHGALGDRRMEAYRQRYGSADYRNAHGVMREVLVKAVNEDYEMQLGALRKQGMAVEMVWGEHDTAAPVAVAERARALLGDDANLTVVDGSGHLLDPPLAAALRAAIGRLG
jgi:pimeloyl-ACP methyl ester carboxylesterase